MVCMRQITNSILLYKSALLLFHIYNDTFNRKCIRQITLGDRTNATCPYRHLGTYIMKSKIRIPQIMVVQSHSKVYSQKFIGIPRVIFQNASMQYSSYVLYVYILVHVQYMYSYSVLYSTVLYTSYQILLYNRTE